MEMSCDTDQKREEPSYMDFLRDNDKKMKESP